MVSSPRRTAYFHTAVNSSFRDGKRVRQECLPFRDAAGSLAGARCAGLKFGTGAALPWATGAGAHRRSGACAGKDRALGGRLPRYWEGAAGRLKVEPEGAWAAALGAGLFRDWEGTAGCVK